MDDDDDDGANTTVGKERRSLEDASDDIGIEDDFNDLEIDYDTNNLESGDEFEDDGYSTEEDGDDGSYQYESEEEVEVDVLEFDDSNTIPFDENPKIEKLNTEAEAKEKTMQCIDFTLYILKDCCHSNFSTELTNLAQRLVKKCFEDFTLAKKQKIKTTTRYGVYFLTIGGRRKIGMSYTSVYRRVGEQKPEDASIDFKAALLMNIDQITAIIPDQIVRDTLELKLPGLQFHDSHSDLLNNLIKTHWAEFLCYACTDCPRGIVLERFFQVPSPRIETIFTELPDDEIDSGSLDALRKMDNFLFFQTWPTISSYLRLLAAGRHRDQVDEQPDPVLKHHIFGIDRKHEYPTKYFFEMLFGEEGTPHTRDYIDAIDECPTVTLCKQLVKEVLVVVVGGGDEVDMSTLEDEKVIAKLKELGKDQKEQIRKLIQERVGNTRREKFKTYIPPKKRDLGKAAAKKFASNDFNNKWINKDCIIVERELISALEAFDPNWKKNNMGRVIELGHNISLSSYKKLGKSMLIVPSFYKIVADECRNETRLKLLASFVHLMKILLQAEKITKGHFDEQVRLLRCFAMRLNMNDDDNGDTGNGGGSKDDSDSVGDNGNSNYDNEQSYHEARTRLYPRKYFWKSLPRNWVVFRSVGDHGIPSAIGQTIAYLLGLKVFEEFMGELYGLEIPTPYNPAFVCKGFGDWGCSQKDTSSRKVVHMVARRFPGHPFHKRFLCLSCRWDCMFPVCTFAILDALGANRTAEENIVWEKMVLTLGRREDSKAKRIVHG